MKRVLYFLISFTLLSFSILFYLENFTFKPYPENNIYIVPDLENKEILYNNNNTQMKVSKINFEPSKILKIWQVENQYLDQKQNLFQGFGPDLISEVKENNYNKKKNILLLGDSYIYGEAIENKEIRWANMLQYYLDKSSEELYGKKIYNVIPIGRGASSFNNYIEWITPERLEKYKPDAIVFSFTGNDDFPSFTEKNFCKELNTCSKDNTTIIYGDCGPRCELASCILGDSSFFGQFTKKFLNPYFPNTAKFVLERYCDPDKLNKRFGLYTERDYNDSIEKRNHPYFKLFQESVVKGDKIIGNIPKFIYYAKYQGFETTNIASYDDFIKNNYEVVDTTYYDLFATDNELSDNNSRCKLSFEYTLNIDDCHPNGLITSKYGKDVSKFIINYFEENKLISKNFLNSLDNEVENLFSISNFMPEFMDYSIENNKIIFSYEKSESNNKFLIYNNILFPCARINHPHNRMVFKRDIEKLVGKKINIKIYLEHSKDTLFYLQPFGINDSGAEIFYDSYSFPSNTTSSLEYVIPKYFSGFMIVDNTYTCDHFLQASLDKMNKEYLSLPTFKIEFSL